MTIEAKSVEGSIKDYLRMGVKNIWSHQVVYILPLLFLVPFVGFLSFTPIYIKQPILMLTALFFFFLYMEITLSTTQEKYTPKKYIASIMVAFYSFYKYFNRHKFYFFIYFIVTIAIRAFFTVMVSESPTPDVSNPMSDFIKGILRFSISYSILDIAVLCSIANEIISDYFVAERMSGLKGMTPKKLTTEAIEKNKKIVVKMFNFVLIFCLFSPVLLFLQPLVFIILISAITFYSMDVFGVDINRKKQEEVETKNFHEFVPILK